MKNILAKTINIYSGVDNETKELEVLCLLTRKKPRTPRGYKRVDSNENEEGFVTIFYKIEKPSFMEHLKYSLWRKFFKKGPITLLSTKTKIYGNN